MSYNPLDDLDVMALTVWAEARGEDVRGQVAVAWVIKNRWLNPRWWSRNRDSIPDDTIAAVVKDPFQFSCWNPNDRNRAKLNDPKTLQDSGVRAIRMLCAMVLRDELPDPTNGADHYCAAQVAAYTNWTKGRKPVAVIGGHLFYKLELK